MAWTRGVSHMKRTLRAGRAISAATLVGAVFAICYFTSSWAQTFAVPPVGGQGHGEITNSLHHSYATPANSVISGAQRLAGERAQTPSAASPSQIGCVFPMLAAAACAFVGKTRSIARSAEGGEGEAPPPPKPKAVRIDAFDSIRFFLISYIVCGHFIGFVKPSPLVFKLITQINVVVGAFFALSGYVAAYTSCELGERKAKDKIVKAPVPAYILSKVFGYWPLHFVVLLLFSPMFIFADNLYNGPWITAAHGLMATTMTQAWFPMHAEIWNAPTWFLGALTFATVLQPYFLPILARQGKQELRRTGFWLTLFLLLPRLAYSYDNSSWGALEGALAAKSFSNLSMYNAMRFTPVWAVMEVMLGFVACRLVMLDGTDGEDSPKPSILQTVLPLLGMVGIIVLRATGTVAFGDLLTRSLIFMPLFCLFLMGLHRASIQKEITDPLAKFLAWKPLTWLGGLAFPIFVVHGPLGQMFYKKAIATKLFGGPMSTVCGPWFFYVYLLSTGVAAWLLNKFFMKSPTVASWSKALQAKILKFL